MFKRKTTPKAPSDPLWLRLHYLAWIVMIVTAVMMIGLRFVTPPTAWGYVRGTVVLIASASYWWSTRRRAAEVEARGEAASEVVVEP